ncbi:hypothetical protein WKI65_01140 [Streptomyces sp. MS1.AVA.3]
MQIPEHVGIDGVDAWTDRSIGSAFGTALTLAAAAGNRKEAAN